MPKVFDGADFDIHELEEPLEVKVAKGKERVTAKMRADLGKAIRAAKPGEERKSLIVALASTIVLPGLGSVYIKRTFAGISLVAFNLLFLVLGLSFFNILTLSFHTQPIASSGYPSLGPVVYYYSPAQFTVLFSWSVAAIIAAWLHFGWQLSKHKEAFEFVA